MLRVQRFRSFSHADDSVEYRDRANGPHNQILQGSLLLRLGQATDEFDLISHMEKVPDGLSRSVAPGQRLVASHFPRQFPWREELLECYPGWEIEQDRLAALPFSPDGFTVQKARIRTRRGSLVASELMSSPTELVHRNVKYKAARKKNPAQIISKTAQFDR